MRVSKGVVGAVAVSACIVIIGLVSESRRSARSETERADMSANEANRLPPEEAAGDGQQEGEGTSIGVVHVALPTSEPSIGAEVRIKRLGSDAELSARTNGDGEATFKVPPGPYGVHVRCAGFPEEQAYARFPGTVVVTPRAGCHVQFQLTRFDSGDWEGVELTLSGPRGAARIIYPSSDDIDAGSWEAGVLSVDAKRLGKRTTIARIAVPEAGSVSVPLSLTTSPRLLLRVRAPNGTPIQRWKATGLVSSFALPTKLDRVETAQGDVFSLQIPSGCGVLRITCEGYAAAFWRVPKSLDPHSVHDVVVEKGVSVEVDVNAVGVSSVEAYYVRAESSMAVSSDRRVYFAPRPVPLPKSVPGTIDMASGRERLPAGAQIAHERTDGKKIVVLHQLPASAYVAIIGSTESGHVSVPAVLIPADVEGTKVLTWEERTDCSLELKTDDGTAVESALIELHELSSKGNRVGWGQSETTTTGKVRVRSALVGRKYTVLARKGVLMQTQEFVPDKGDMCYPILWRPVPLRTVAVRVLDSDGGAVSNEYVSFNVSNGTSVGRVTDAEGRASADVPEGQKIIVVFRRAMDGLIVTRVCSEADTEMTMRVPRSRRGATLTVMLSGQASNVDVGVFANGKRKKHKTVYVDGNGEIRFPHLAPGRYVFEATSSTGVARVEAEVREWEHTAILARIVP